MPAPKPNGFYMFMLGEQKAMKALTGRAPGMREMPGICRDKWKKLPQEEKNRFDAMAKKEKEKLQNSDANFSKLDCHRQVIADRRDPVKEDRKRRTQERRSLQESWTDQDTRDIVFYILDFQVMYDDVSESHHFPLEIGMVSFTLRKGVTNFMHRFIDPGEVPQGNRHLATSHSENSHKIPLKFEHSDANLKALTNHMTDFIKSNCDHDDRPPIFCLSVHRNLVENCLDFIYSKVFMNDLNKIDKVYCLEDLVTCLIANSGKAEKSVAESQVFDMLCQNRWDYNSSIRCFYHEELDCSFCSLSIVRRYSFALFDMLSKLLDFELTDKHMPDEVSDCFTVTESVGFGRQSRKYGDNNNAWRSGRDPSPSESSYSNRRRYHHGGAENAWRPPTVDPVKVPLSDDESDEEVREEAKPQEYTLQKLRLPKSLAQVQMQVGQVNLRSDDEPTSQPSVPVLPNPAINRVPNANPRMPMGIPMGRGRAPIRMPQPEPLGQRAPMAGIRPPPGLWPRPGLSSMPGQMPGGGIGLPPGLTHPSSGASEEDFPALSRGRGVPRGRARLAH